MLSKPTSMGRFYVWDLDQNLTSCYDGATNLGGAVDLLDALLRLEREPPLREMPMLHLSRPKSRSPCAGTDADIHAASEAC